MLGAALTEETRRVVERYDSALQQIAHLKSENRSLKEHLRQNEVKVMRLINHYQQEIDERTHTITNLNDERRAQEQYQMQQRHRQFSDKSTEIGEGDFNTKVTELEQIIYMLEDEIQALKDSHRLQQEHFERQTLHNEALTKESFNQNIDALRSMVTDSVSAEVADALSDLLYDNERLSTEFRNVLSEVERLQLSRDALSKELMRTRRELDFVTYTNEKLMEEKRNAVKLGKEECSFEYGRSAIDEEQEDEEHSNCLEEYFRESLRLRNIE